VHCTKHVVIGQQMIEAERIRRPPDAAKRLNIAISSRPSGSSRPS
jgi:hypothetical protein